MATLTLNQPTSDSVIQGTVTANDPFVASWVQITSLDGTRTVLYQGFFVFSGPALIAGSVNSITYSISGIPQYTITGLSHDAVTIYNYITTGNTEGYLSFIFSGGDSFIGSAGNDLLQSWAGNDSLNGFSGADTLIGDGGGDSLDGGIGADSMIGGSGADHYFVNHVGDVVVETDSEDGDTVRSSITYTLPGNVENLVLDDLAINGVGNGLNNRIYVWNSGNSSANRLSGLGGNDSIDGSDNDTLVGGSGDDFYQFSETNGFPWVVELAGEGIDVISIYSADSAFNLPAHVEHLYLQGSHAVGNVENNQLYVLGRMPGSNSTVDGGLGADTMQGGNENTLYLVDSQMDVVLTDTGGRDTVSASASFEINDDIETLVLSGSGHINGKAGQGNNLILGNSGNNRLDGSGAVDSMVGGAGDDVYLIDAIAYGHSFSVNAASGDIASQGGGAFSGNTVSGFFAVDLLDENHNNVIDGVYLTYTPSGNTAEMWRFAFSTYGLGQDLSVGNYSSAIRWPVSMLNHPGLLAGKLNVGLFELSGLVGNFEVQDLVIDYSGSQPVLQEFSAIFQQFSQGVGSPLLSGTIQYDMTSGFMEPVVELAGQGNDLIISAISAELPEHVERLILSGTNHSNATGNGLDNLLSGNSGDNILDGDGGADIIAGGAGSDVYVIDNSGDQVMELGNSGNDSIQSAVSYDLMQSWHVEHLTLTGGGAVNGSGNWMNNVLIGNASGNRLDGNRGNDVLDGGSGSDTLIGGADDDLLIWDAVDGRVDGGTGIDILQLNGEGNTLNLVALPDSVITGIEIIDLTGSGSNTLTLALGDVLAISSTTDILRVDGNSGDVVNAGGGWTSAGTQMNGAQAYAVYTQLNATLLVDANVLVSLA